MRLSFVCITIAALGIGCVPEPVSTEQGPGTGPGGVDAAGNAPITERVTRGLAALYTFQEGTGITVADQSGNGLTLSIVNGAGVTWIQGGGMDVAVSSLLATEGPATSLATACQASNQLTVETWGRAATTDQDGPARVVTMSPDTQSRNFTLGQEGPLGNVRLRTSATDENGTPATVSDMPVFKAQISHTVYTRVPGQSTIWVDGAQVAQNPVEGDFSNWNPDYPLALFNEPTEDRPWVGQLYLVAVYCQVLSDEEIRAHHTLSY